MRRTAIKLGVIVLLVAFFNCQHSVLAFFESYEDPTPEPNSPEIYIVQPGDTLYAIAQQYELSVEALALANDISVSVYLSVGQQLIIPLPVPEPSPVIDHIFQPNETLRSIGLNYGLSVVELATANYLLRPDIFPSGETLQIPGLTDERPKLAGGTHIVLPGDTLIGIAAQHGTFPWVLAESNGLEHPTLVPPSQRLWIPGENGLYRDLIAPIQGITIHPLPPEQGQTVSIQVSTTIPVSLTARFLDKPVVFHNGSYGTAALVGIPALWEKGVYSLIVTPTLSNEEFPRYISRVAIASGDYISEVISVSEEIAAEMTVQVTQAEQQMLDDLFAVISPIRQWDGPFSTPTPDPITSWFGTRRSYNIPQGSLYHTGTDFASVMGTWVTAPANGIVIYTGPLTVRGNVVILDHGWGVMSGYWHLSSSYVTVGESVYRGQHIADTGNTGLSTGAHLHWEMRVGGVSIDALQWINERFP